jgi:hypothetical protein
MNVKLIRNQELRIIHKGLSRDLLSAVPLVLLLMIQKMLGIVHKTIVV